jgi:hypothetical protein
MSGSFQCSVRQTTLKGQVLTGSISTATLLRLILVNLPLLPDENKEEEAKLLPNTSFVVKLAQFVLRLAYFQLTE